MAFLKVAQETRTDLLADVDVRDSCPTVYQDQQFSCCLSPGCFAYALTATTGYNAAMSDPNPYEPPRDTEPAVDAARKTLGRREIAAMSALLLFAALNAGVAGIVQAGKGAIWQAAFAFTFAFGILAAFVVYHRRRRLANQEEV